MDEYSFMDWILTQREVPGVAGDLVRSIWSNEDEGLISRLTGDFYDAFAEIESVTQLTGGTSAALARLWAAYELCVPEEHRG